ncbi:MAG: DUF4288 domain-containing protein [Planctomycetales bacterium]|nr:DUF4288 domain-containing protein [Planctomycetales bacterium]
MHMKNSEPWYGVRLIYRLTGMSRPAYEERILIVRANSEDDAIARAERCSREYESETAEYIGYAMSFHIFDEDGACLEPGTEVFSLIRESQLDPADYLDRFHDSGSERARSDSEN